LITEEDQAANMTEGASEITVENATITTDEDF
jgi:hypothetical protein